MKTEQDVMGELCSEMLERKLKVFLSSRGEQAYYKMILRFLIFVASITA